MEASSEIFQVILWAKTFTAAAPAQQTRFLTRQISLSGLNGEDYAEE